MIPTDPFVSSLPQSPARFLAEALDHALNNGRRSPADFIRHFPPSVVMGALDAVPQLRAIFLTMLVGVREKTALRTSAADAGRLLQAALEEDDCDAESIVEVFNPDDRIRYLDSHKVWAFLTEGDYWKVSRAKDAAAHKTAQTHIAYMLDRALAHGLVTHADIFSGITVEVLAEKLPRGEMAKIIKQALTVGRDGQAFTEKDLFVATPSTVLVDHIALPQIVDGVVMPMARKVGYVDKPADAPAGEPLPSWSATPPEPN